MKAKLVKIMSVGVMAIICTGALLAQNSGVFKTFADYSIGKMEYGIDCATEKHKIRLNQFFGKDYITVIHEGKPFELKKAQTWGYQLCDERIIRFQKNEHYPVEEKRILWIYTKETVQTSGRGNIKGITLYYFSKGGNGEIEELTLMNIKDAFADNQELREEINRLFDTDVSLREFDKFHKKYAINYFLENREIN